MAKVLAISSQTVFGPVGNSAAVPALQSAGHEVMHIPTVLLSNHPGLGKPAGQSSSVDLINAIFSALHSVSAFTGLAAVMTGYFTSAAQVMAVAEHLAVLKTQHETLHVLVDPVLGDHGKLYVAEDVARAIRDHLLPLASITTPNVFELHYLTEKQNIVDAARSLGVAEVLVTSVHNGPSSLGTELHLAHTSEVQSHFRPQQAGVPHGTGDFLAGCYLAERLRQSPEAAFRAATQRLDLAIAKSLGLPGLVLS